MNHNENEKNVLDEVNKGACMGKDAVHFLLDKAKSEKMKHELKVLSSKYDTILHKTKNIFPHYSWGEPHKTSTMNKVMTWYGIEMKTFMDESDSKVAEILLQGLNMGIIEGRRLLNHKDCDAKVQLLTHEFVSLQEEAVETFKLYL